MRCIRTLFPYQHVISWGRGKCQLMQWHFMISSDAVMHVKSLSSVLYLAASYSPMQGMIDTSLKGVSVKYVHAGVRGVEDRPNSVRSTWAQPNYKWQSHILKECTLALHALLWISVAHYLFTLPCAGILQGSSTMVDHTYGPSEYSSLPNNFKNASGRVGYKLKRVNTEIVDSPQIVNKGTICTGGLRRHSRTDRPRTQEGGYQAFTWMR